MTPNLFLSSRRTFLSTSTGVLAATIAGSAPGQSELRGSGERPLALGAARRKIPIGVFDPAFPDMPLDQVLEKFSAWGVEAVEMATGGYSRNKHFPTPELLDDPAKLQALRTQVY